MDVDLANRRLNLPDSKTGRKIVYLLDAAVAVVKGTPIANGNPFVFPGRVDGRSLVSIKRAWDNIRKNAGIAEARMHDLRHTFASIGV
jgi:integrase